MWRFFFVFYPKKMGRQPFSSKNFRSFLYLQGTNDDPKNKEKKKKPTVKMIDLTLEARTHGYTIDELRKYHEEEVNFGFADLTPPNN